MLVVCHSLFSCFSAAAVTFLYHRSTEQSKNTASLCSTAKGKKGSLRVAVADADSRHASKQIQVSPPVHVPQPLVVPVVDVNRSLVVGDAHGHGVAILLADLHHPFFGQTLNSHKYKGEEGTV